MATWAHIYIYIYAYIQCDVGAVVAAWVRRVAGSSAWGCSRPQPVGASRACIYGHRRLRVEAKLHVDVHTRRVGTVAQPRVAALVRVRVRVRVKG